MVHVPIYLNMERSAILCAVHLKGQRANSLSESVLPMAVPWYELGTAITLWSDP